jgi:uncharacterized phage infection (PIP) family protein YhgE
MEEQSEGSKQLLQSSSSLNEITQQVRSGSGEMLEGSKEVIKESQNLSRLTQEITGGMNEITIGADQMNVAVHHVSEISGKDSNCHGNQFSKTRAYDKNKGCAEYHHGKAASQTKPRNPIVIIVKFL